jgi:hypothetical protein
MKALAVAALLGICWINADAQFFKAGPDKTVELAVVRPPQFELTVRRVAFGKPGGSCDGIANELLDRMILPDFQQNQIDVIERQALDQIMAEHNFNQSSYADASSAAQLGRILGPSALIVVTVDDCRADRDQLINKQQAFLSNNAAVTFLSKTRYALEGSIRVVDLTNGKLLGSHNFESKPEKSNQSQQGYPEYPPVDELKDEAMEAVKSQIHGMFFPYGNVTNLVFYDDKDCDLKLVYEMYRNGDHDGAFHSIDQKLEQCKSGGGKKDKTLARAYYDAGVLHCVFKDYDAADANFRSAMDGKGADAVPTASAACQQARAAESQLKAYRQREAQIPAPAPIASPAPVVAAGPAPNAAPAPPSQAASNSGTAPPPPNSAPSVEDRLKKLDSLYKRGLITKPDYDKKKAEILKDL